MYSINCAYSCYVSGSGSYYDIIHYKPRLTPVFSVLQIINNKRETVYCGLI